MKGSNYLFLHKLHPLASIAVLYIALKESKPDITMTENYRKKDETTSSESSHNGIRYRTEYKKLINNYT